MFGAAEAWEFDAASVEVVERYFTVDVGSTIRRVMGLPGELRVPFLLEELASGKREEASLKHHVR